MLLYTYSLQGQTPLHVAARLDRAEIASLLVAHGSNPSTQDDNVRTLSNVHDNVMCQYMRDTVRICYNVHHYLMHILMKTCRYS